MLADVRVAGLTTCFVTVQIAPLWFMVDCGFVEMILQSPPLTNQYVALPSLHIGSATLRMSIVLATQATIMAVNHLLDGIADSAMAQKMEVERRPEAREPHRPFARPVSGPRLAPASDPGNEEPREASRGSSLPGWSLDPSGGRAHRVRGSVLVRIVGQVMARAAIGIAD